MTGLPAHPRRAPGGDWFELNIPANSIRGRREWCFAHCDHRGMWLRVEAGSDDPQRARPLGWSLEFCPEPGVMVSVSVRGRTRLLAAKIAASRSIPKVIEEAHRKMWAPGRRLRLMEVYGRSATQVATLCSVAVGPLRDRTVVYDPDGRPYDGSAYSLLEPYQPHASELREEDLSSLYALGGLDAVVDALDLRRPWSMGKGR